MNRLALSFSIICLSACAPHVDPTDTYLKHQNAMLAWHGIQGDADLANIRCWNKLLNYPGAFQKGNDVATAAGYKAADDCRADIQRKLELELAKQPLDVQQDVREEWQRIKDMNNSRNRFDGVHDAPAGGGSASSTEALDANTRAIEAQTRQMQADSLYRTIMGN
ncbi:MAG: hypothetical protein E7A35_05260 [Leclercia adecarboxylata]|nr:hypothetical protein [Leclercia adecarboxylata]